MTETIAAEFPESDVEVIDIKPLIIENPGILGINAVLTLSLYGKDILSGQKKFKEAFWRTPYIFVTVKKLLAKKLEHKKYWFTFQMQSLFDCSLPNTSNFVYTDHTHLANLSYPGFNQQKLYEKWVKFERRIYQNARINFVRSTNIRQSLIDHYQQSPDKVMLVYAGSNIEPDTSITYRKSYTDQNILFVGMDWERKGGPELLKAFLLVRQRFPNASLTIVGSKPDIQLPNCRILGQVPPSEVSQFYKSATLFCMPTRVEPFGIAFLEAMQARLPIVATNVGAIQDFIQNNWNGILVEPGDVQGIAHGIMRLIANEDICQLFGERNIRISRERYSWPVVGKKIHKHIMDSLSEEI
jgi:glycosyltransferase involved in cell wall biosynthesis